MPMMMATRRFKKKLQKQQQQWYVATVIVVEAVAAVVVIVPVLVLVILVVVVVVAAGVVIVGVALVSNPSVSVGTMPAGMPSVRRPGTWCCYRPPEPLIKGPFSGVCGLGFKRYVRSPGETPCGFSTSCWSRDLYYIHWLPLVCGNEERLKDPTTPELSNSNPAA